MSRGVGYIFIEGDHIADIDKILGAFGYREEVRSFKVRDFEEARILAFYYPGGECFGIGMYKGWTVIIDHDKLIVRKPHSSTPGIGYDLWGILSSGFNMKVLDLWTQDTINRVTFHLFDGGRRIRAFENIGGDIKEDEGDPLPVESQFDGQWHDVRDVWKMMKAVTGFDEDELISANPGDYIVKIYDHYGELSGQTIVGYVHDEHTGEYVRDANVKLYIGQALIDSYQSQYPGIFFINVPRGTELSGIAGQNKIIAEKNGKAGHVFISKNNLAGVHRIFIK